MWIKYDKKIKTPTENLKKGDVCYFEYGDYDNWVTMVFDSMKHDGSWHKMEFHMPLNTKKEIIYTDDKYFYVVGKEQNGNI